MTESTDDLEPRIRQKGLEIVSPCTRRLEEQAKSGDAGASLAAIKALGKIGDESVMATLLDLTQDEVRAEESVIALSQIRSPAVLPKLIEVMSHSVPGLKATCVSVLWRFKDELVVDKLAPLIKAPHVPVRKAVMESLGKLGLASGAEALLAGLDDADEGVVVSALKSLRILDLPDRSKLGAALTRLYEKAPPDFVRATIVAAFSKVEDASLLDVAKKALKDKTPRVRANAVELIGAMPLTNELKGALLRGMITDGEHNRVLGNVAIGLSEVDPAKSLQILSKLLNSPEKWERASAVYAARYLKTDRVTSWLTTQFISENDPDVLRNLIESLGFFSGKEVSACFLRAIRHHSTMVRLGAARCLARAADRDTAQDLLEVVQREEDPEVLAEMITALGKVADPSRISVLSRFLQSSDLRVQANTIEALQSIGTVEIIPYVEPFLNSHDNRVKANAAVALWNSGSVSVLQDLERMLESPNIKQRSSAAYAIGEIGASLGELRNLPKFFLLISALKELLEKEGLEAEAKAAEAKAREPTGQWPVGAMEGVATGKWPVPGGPAAAPGATVEPFLEMSMPGISIRAIEERLKGAEDSAEDVTSETAAALVFIEAEERRRGGEALQALEAFEALEHLDPGFINARVLRASVLNQERRIGESVQQYFLALQNQVKVVQEQIQMGLELIQEEQVSEASLLLKQLVGQFAIDQQLHRKAGLEFLKKRRFQLAWKHLVRAYLVTPSDADLLLKLSLVAVETARYDEARSLAEKVVMLETSRPEDRERAMKVMKLAEKRASAAAAGSAGGKG